MANKEQIIDSKLLDELLKDQDPQTVLSVRLQADGTDVLPD